MKTLPVSEEMKAKIQPYFNSETNRYDLAAIRETMRAEMKDRNVRYANIFAGFGDDDQTFEHTMLSAADQLNEELDYADTAVQNTDAIVSDIVNKNYPADDPYGDKTINARFNRLTLENQRQFVHKLLLVLDGLDMNIDKHHTIKNRILYSFTNHFHLGHESGGNNDVQFTHIDLNNAYRFVERGKTTGEIFTDLPEEYLASLGL